MKTAGAAEHHRLIRRFHQRTVVSCTLSCSGRRRLGPAAPRAGGASGRRPKSAHRTASSLLIYGVTVYPAVSWAGGLGASALRLYQVHICRWTLPHTWGHGPPLLPRAAAVAWRGTRSSTIAPPQHGRCFEEALSQCFPPQVSALRGWLGCEARTPPPRCLPRRVLPTVPGSAHSLEKDNLTSIANIHIGLLDLTLLHKNERLSRTGSVMETGSNRSQSFISSPTRPGSEPTFPGRGEAHMGPPDISKTKSNASKNGKCGNN